jgi:hypothetical protein
LMTAAQRLSKKPGNWQESTPSQCYMSATCTKTQSDNALI